jgi:hypothetical protein
MAEVPKDAIIVTAYASADRAFLPLVLYLQPIFPVIAVNSVLPFRNYSFQISGANFLKQPDAIAHDMVRVEDLPALSLLY